MAVVNPGYSEAQANASTRYYSRESAKKNEVGDLPPIKEKGLREDSMGSLLFFLITFFSDPPFFTNPFGEVQLSSIAHEEAVLLGQAGNINKLEPRAYGKSVRSILSALWASLRGVQDFSMICSDSTEKSSDLLKMAHTALGENEKLLAAFPELYPFHKLDGNPHKCQYQTYQGNRTKISIKGDTIYFPVLGGQFDCEAAMIVSRPYLKARGKNVEGRRPTVIYLDDIQSTEEAMSPTSVRKNIKVLTSDIAFLGTREKPVTIINNATIIEVDDFPSKVAEMDAFTTVRYKMVESFPVGCEPGKGNFSEHWTKYFEIRKDYNREKVGDRLRASLAATAYYEANREEMDKGSSVTWDYAFSFERKQEISTIQAAMNFIVDYNWKSFKSECQNEPPDRDDDSSFLTAAEITLKQHAQPRGVVPREATTLVGFIDVQMEMFFLEVWAFAEDFTGFKIFDAEYPDQESLWFEKRKLKRKLSTIDRYKNISSLEGRIKQGILDLWDEVLNLEFKRDGDGNTMQISMLGTDTGFKGSTIESAYLDSPHKNRIMLCRGYGFKAKQKPQREKKTKKGERKGHGWFLPLAHNGIQVLQIDTNLLKSFFHQRLATSLGDPGSFSSWKAPPQHHELSGSHYKAEYRTTLRGPYGDVDEWEEMPGKPDNDRLDCAVGCIAIAGHQGIKMAGADYTETKKKRKKIDWSTWGK